MSISGGPEIVTCSVPVSPAPNTITTLISPRWIWSPVLAALIVVPGRPTPSSSALMLLPPAGAPTVMSTPPAVWPATTGTGAAVCTAGAVEPPVAGGGVVPVGGGVVEFLPLPPQAARLSARRRTATVRCIATPAARLIGTPVLLTLQSKDAERRTVVVLDRRFHQSGLQSKHARAPASYFKLRRATQVSNCAAALVHG